MGRPVFTIKKWYSDSFPYVFECKGLCYQVVFTNIEAGKKSVEARFGKCIFRLSKELQEEQK